MRGLHRRRPARPRVDASLFLLRARNREYPIDNPKVVKALPVIESPTALRLPLAFARLLAQIRRDKPAIVCSHGLLCNMLAVAARKILRGRFAIVAFEHSSPAIHYGASRMRRLKYWLVSQTYRRHDAVVGVSEGVKEDLVSMFPPLRARFIPSTTACRWTTCASKASRRRPRDGSGRQDEPYQVVAVGRLEAVKDYATLIDAAALLDDPRIAFTIVEKARSTRPCSAASMRGRPAPRCAWRVISTTPSPPSPGPAPSP